MASTTPIFDLLMMPTYNPKTMAIGDATIYPAGWNAAVPTIQITPPGYPTSTQSFVPGGIQVYNAYSLGIYTNDMVECNYPELPDGIYKIKYTNNPANQYFVEKTFFRTYQIEADKDEAFLKLEIMECDGQIKKQKKQTIDLIEYYINGAIASANKCALKQATELYNKARKMLDAFLSSSGCNC